MADWLARARTAVVKCFDGAAGVACDVVVNNEIAVHNSELLRCYGQARSRLSRHAPWGRARARRHAAPFAQVEPRFRQLALLLKGWAAARECNKAATGTLSS